jgi:hypothetical protein
MIDNRKLNILVVEDMDKWRNAIVKALISVGEDSEILNIGGVKVTEKTLVAEASAKTIAKIEQTPGTITIRTTLTDRHNKRNSCVIAVSNAVNYEEASKIIRTTFFDAALVDLDLREKSKNKSGNFWEGIDVLKKLKKDRPSCRRIILTQNWGHDTPAAEQFSPDHDNARFMFLKHNDTLDHVASALVASLAGPSVTLENPDAVLHALAGKKATDSKAIKTNEDELHYLMTSLFSPNGLREEREEIVLGQSAPQNPDMDIKSIHLDEFSKGGMSRTVAFHGRPRDKRGNEMLWCVVKIGAQSLIFQEYRNYNRYVRYNLSPARRVELLGYAMADSVGAICYSFAGERPLNAESLESLIDTDHAAVEKCLDVLFDPSPKERYWYALTQDAATTVGRDGGGLRQRLAFGEFDNSIKELNSLPEFAERIVAHLREKDDPKANYRKKQISLGNGHGLKVPDHDTLGLLPLQRPYFECIVHGDLHGGNVMVTFDEFLPDSNNIAEQTAGAAKAVSGKNTPMPRVVRIDFAHTGIGPIAHEFAQMETSVRTSTAALQAPFLEMLSDQVVERAIWNDVWSTSDWDRPTWNPEREVPRWARYSRKIAWLARKNFAQHNRHFLTEDAYASTCLMCAVQRLRWENSFEEDDKIRDTDKIRLRDAVKLRLLVWISHLAQLLESC